MKTKTTITITFDDENPDGLSVRMAFEPDAKTAGPMTKDQAAGLVAMEAIKDWASGER